MACEGFAQVEEEKDGRIDVLPSIIGTEEYVTNKYCGLEAVYGSPGSPPEDNSYEYEDRQYNQGEASDKSSLSQIAGMQGSSFKDPFMEPAVGTFSRSSSQFSAAVPEVEQRGSFDLALAAGSAESMSPTVQGRRRKSSAESRRGGKAMPPASRDGDDQLLSDDNELFGAENDGAEEPKSKATYALSFDDIFGHTKDELKADSLFDSNPHPREEEAGGGKKEPDSVAVAIPRRNLQTSLAKILTESPSVGLFDEHESQIIKKKKEADETKPNTSSQAVAKPEVSDSTSKYEDQGTILSQPQSQPPLPGLPTFASDIPTKQSPSKVKGTSLDSILSESPSVGLFDEDPRMKRVLPMPQKVKPESIAPKAADADDSTTSAGALLGGKEEERSSLEENSDTGGASEPVAARTQAARVSFLDPFALARAKQQESDSDSDGSFSSSDDFESDSKEADIPPPKPKPESADIFSSRSVPDTLAPQGATEKQETSPVRNAEDEKEEQEEENAFAFSMADSAQAPSETPSKIPQTKISSPSVVENPFATSSSDIFGDKKKPAEEEEDSTKGKGASTFSSDSFDSLFGGPNPAASRRKSSNLFDNPFESQSQQQTVKGSPFGGSDLFSSDSSLFKTTEREKKLSKGLFDDFLSEDSKKSGGGLFD